MGAEKPVIEIFVKEKEKWPNKGTDKQYVADSFIQFNLSLPSFVPNFKILSQIVPEKFLMEKQFTHRQTHKHCYRKGKNYIPPIYFVYQGYDL